MNETVDISWFRHNRAFQKAQEGKTYVQALKCSKIKLKNLIKKFTDEKVARDFEDFPRHLLASVGKTRFGMRDKNKTDKSDILS